MILKREFLLSIFNCQIDFSTVHVDNGFCGAQKRSTQDNGCPYISTYVQNHKVYDYVWASNSYIDIFKNFPWGSKVIDLQAANAYLCKTKDLLKFSHKLP